MSNGSSNYLTHSLLKQQAFLHPFTVPMGELLAGEVLERAAVTAVTAMKGEKFEGSSLLVMLAWTT